MPLFRRFTARQKEIRRSKAERRPVWYQRYLGPVQFRSLAILFVSAVSASLIVNVGEDVPNLREGQYLTRAITSRVPFSVADEVQTQAERRRARDAAEVYYTLDTSLVTDILGRLTGALRLAREHGADPQRLIDSAAGLKLVLDDAAAAELIRIAEHGDAAVYERAVARAVETLRAMPLVEVDELVPRRTNLEAVLVDPEAGGERRVPVNRLLYPALAEPSDVSRVAEEVSRQFPAPLRRSMQTSLVEMLRRDEGAAYRPLYRYNSQRSAAAADEAERQVDTKTIDYRVGSILADVGTLRPDEVKLLNEEHRQYTVLRDTTPELLHAHRRGLAARTLLTFLAVFGFGGYVLLLLRDTERGQRPQPRIATAVVLLLIVLVARAIYLETPWPYAATGLQAIVVALLAVISRRIAAQAAGALIALLITLATRQNTGFLVVLIAVSVVFYLGLQTVRNRGRIIAVGSLAAAIVLVLTILVGLIDRQPLSFLFWQRGIWAALTTLGAAFIFEGILPGIERMFGITTDMTLLEWCDPNKPLLRMLAAESPGTYNHSLMVGALADAAANAIGANGLLARAGAYYHDIGKVNKPEYFVENQALGMGNRHERLSPAMSHLIIVNHVKDGIEMAKAYGVPTRLHPFIPEHHGTTVVEFFYHAASEARKPGDPEVSDTQFRYPGPKPQSRETAIVMLCDGVEGAVRAMSEPTPNRIEDTVSGIVQKRLADGQLDECDLTFRELAMIRQTLVKNLISIYHGRITYPTAREENSRTGETGANGAKREASAEARGNGAPTPAGLAGSDDAHNSQGPETPRAATRESPDTGRSAEITKPRS